MRAISQSFRVRKLIGQTRVPYNRGLRVRGSCIQMIVKQFYRPLPPKAKLSVSKQFICHWRTPAAFP